MKVKGIDYTVKEGEVTHLYRVSYNEYREWIDTHTEYKIGRTTETESSMMVHRTTTVRKNK